LEATWPHLRNKSVQLKPEQEHWVWGDGARWIATQKGEVKNHTYDFNKVLRKELETTEKLRKRKKERYPDLRMNAPLAGLALSEGALPGCPTVLSVERDVTGKAAPESSWHAARRECALNHGPEAGPQPVSTTLNAASGRVNTGTVDAPQLARAR
jgi:hypothetical protein